MKKYSVVKEYTLKIKSRERVTDYKINTPQLVYSFVKEKISDEAQENVVCLYLNNKNEIQSWSHISRGTVSETIVHPREVFKYAIMSNSSAFIMAHNHPSGLLNPSQEDIELTNRLMEAGNLLGISLLDHVIVSTEGFYSFREHDQI